MEGLRTLILCLSPGVLNAYDVAKHQKSVDVPTPVNTLLTNINTKLPEEITPLIQSPDGGTLAVRINVL